MRDPISDTAGWHAEDAPALSVVVPLYNEQENVEGLHARLSTTLGALDLPYELLFVDDGSQDATTAILERLRAHDPRVGLVRLSRNFGHQAAVSAGLDHAQGQAVIVMDGDLQDPPEVLPQFIARWREGFDVVYAVRASRREGPFKRLGYFAFYRLFRAVSELDVPLDSGDFCLMDRRVVETLRALPERMRFVRGLRAFVGFRQTGLAYDRDARAAGRPKYSLGALVRLAADGLVSFSSRPLRLVTWIGGLTIALAALLGVWVLCDAFWNQTAPRGWASLIAVVLFMSSVQLLCLGIIGEYVRLIFLESKRRPTYIVEEYAPARARRAESSER